MKQRGWAGRLDCPRRRGVLEPNKSPGILEKVETCRTAIVPPSSRKRPPVGPACGAFSGAHAHAGAQSACRSACVPRSFKVYAAHYALPKRQQSNMQAAATRGWQGSEGRGRAVSGRRRRPDAKVQSQLVPASAKSCHRTQQTSVTCRPRAGLLAERAPNQPRSTKDVCKLRWK